VRIFWRIGLALLVAAGIAAGLERFTASQRFANLDLEGGGFRDTFLMFSKSEPGRGYVVNRRDSTERRSDLKLPGRKWEFFRIPLAEDTDAWLTRSKRQGKGTVFYVPVSEVGDWTYPFLYEFVRERRPKQELPPIEWTQLYVNRIYQGLYLRVALPFDLRKKDGGSGILRQILVVGEGLSSQLNTRFQDTPGVYAAVLADGIFPELARPDPLISWLAGRCPTSETTFLLSNKPPYGVSLLPLPISLVRLFEAGHGRTPSRFEDERYERWLHAAEAAVSAAGPLRPADRAALETHFAHYATSFLEALRLSAELHGDWAALQERLPERQDATLPLGLSLESFDA
jgi:hypothetical protein